MTDVKKHIEKLLEVTESINLDDLEKKAISEWRLLLHFNDNTLSTEISYIMAYKTYLDVKGGNDFIISKFSIDDIEKSMKWLSDIKGTNYDGMKTPVLFALRHLSYQFVSPLLNNFEKEEEKLKDLIKNSSVDFDIDKLVEYLEYSSLYDV